MTHSLLPLLALLIGTLAASAEVPKERRYLDQGSTDKRLAGYHVPEGLTLEVVFDRAVKNPAALAFGDDGTPYVLEFSTAKGVVKALVASKAGGPLDSAKAVLEVEQPGGMLWHDGRLYLVGAGTLRRYKPAEAGGKFYAGEVVTKGIGSAGLAIGPDGWLYIRAGTISRCRPDGTKLHTFATGFQRSSGSLGFDVGGHAFAADGPRLFQVSEASDFGTRIRAGSLPAMFDGKGNLYAGVTIYNDTQWPEAFRGRLLALDPAGHAVRAFDLTQSGAAFGVGKGFDLVRGPKVSAFRPSQAVVGPDGALYVVADRIYRLRQTDAPLRNVKRPGKMSGESDENLLRFLSDENATVRAAAQADFIRRGDKNRKALVELLMKNKEPIVGKLAAVGVLQAMYDKEVQKAFLQVLNNGDDELRRAVAEALGQCAKRADADVGDGLLEALVAEDNDLRRAVALAMARVASPGTADNLAATLKDDDGKDFVLHDGLVRALEMLGKPGIESLVRIADSGVQKDTDHVATTFLGLRTGPAFDALPRLLKNPHLSTAQRIALVESTSNYRLDGPMSLEAIVAAVAVNAKESDDVRVAVLKALVARRAANGPKTAEFVVAQLGNNNLDVRMAALATATELRVTAASAVLGKALAGELSEEERKATVRALKALKKTLPPKRKDGEGEK